MANGRRSHGEKGGRRTPSRPGPRAASTNSVQPPPTLCSLHQLCVAIPWYATYTTRSRPSAETLGPLWGAGTDRLDDQLCEGSAQPSSGRGINTCTITLGMVCIYINMYIYTYIHIYTYTYIYICICVYIHTCVCIYMCTYICIW